MSFDDWYNEIEVYSLRCERFYDQFRDIRGSQLIDIEKWLRAAYEAGYEQGKSE
jgi:hypothetical protein